LYCLHVGRQQNDTIVGVNMHRLGDFQLFRIGSATQMDALFPALPRSTPLESS